MKNDVEKVRIEILRNEIAQRNLEIHSLESIAKELPKTGLSAVRCISPESASWSSSGPSSASGSPDLTYSPDIDAKSPSLGFVASDDRYYYNYPVMNGTSTSSRVIETLQVTIDALKRDLNVQTERAREERRNRETVQRKLESQNEQFDRIRHQNDMFNSILNRKDRKLDELEKRLATEIDLRKASDSEMKTIKERIRELEVENAREREAKWHAHSSYDALVASNRQSAVRFRDEVRLLKSEMERISNSRKEDLQQLQLLEAKLVSMSAEKDNVIKIQQSATAVRNEQIEDVKAALKELQKRVGKYEVGDDELLRQVKEELERIRWISRNSSEESI
ncbi:hypothetical protein POJ06DRAFT_51118 [Lipomyces tetrasporus]|uniref:SWI5-dependent HO expression protein 3 n=1 Tax=Lipomyces tetrasporus TaxID=54092 RepID=A0AAD7QWH7_9ASCO|nr:uncharacterized protein POJ06DRAFT_51118 [Lipomyces tetrasporus]KAJ8102526.1 hypothetical protein POJ06DRAFT_51118 [Lipomyces tetrasporus]